MTVITHPVAPEEIMTLLDGELSRAEAEIVSQHVEQCAECAAIRDQFRNTSESLARWTVPAPSPQLDRAVEERAAAVSPTRRSAIPEHVTPLSVRNWRLWAIGGGGAIGALALVALITSTVYSHEFHAIQSLKAREIAMQQESTVEPYAYSNPAPPPPPPASQPAGIAGMESDRLVPPSPASQTVQGNNGLLIHMGGGGGGGVAPAPTPMIARNVSLIILVKDISASRSALDAILAHHQGYAAQLTINTPENGARSFQSSLRIPAPGLASALEALRTLGRVQTETQSGEEVTQQHADLVARLTNARETEQRLRDLLLQRTGKMQDVLDVEEKISDTRGEIEQMEAEQKALEHRVDFATIDLQLTEEFKAQLGTESTSAGTRVHNSFIAGIRNAGSSLLGFILFLEEVGPVTFIWIVILGTPVLLVWRYRRARRSKF